MVPPLPAALSPILYGHQRRVSADEPSYASAMEPSTARRPRASSQVVRTPLAPATPLKGILKTGEGANRRSICVADVIISIDYL
jgi:hypothetical protein